MNRRQFLKMTSASALAGENKEGVWCYMLKLVTNM